MSIMYKYLDKRAATIAAIKDFDSMRFIISSTDKDITAEREKMTGVGSPNMDGMPHAYNPSAAEERIAGSIDEIDVLKDGKTVRSFYASDGVIVAKQFTDLDASESTMFVEALHIAHTGLFEMPSIL